MLITDLPYSGTFPTYASPAGTSNILGALGPFSSKLKKAASSVVDVVVIGDSELHSGKPKTAGGNYGAVKNAFPYLLKKHLQAAYAPGIEHGFGFLQAGRYAEKLLTGGANLMPTGIDMWIDTSGGGTIATNYGLNGGCVGGRPIKMTTGVGQTCKFVFKVQNDITLEGGRCKEIWVHVNRTTSADNTYSKGTVQVDAWQAATINNGDVVAAGAGTLATSGSLSVVSTTYEEHGYIIYRITGVDPTKPVAVQLTADASSILVVEGLTLICDDATAGVRVHDLTSDGNAFRFYEWNTETSAGWSNAQQSWRLWTGGRITPSGTSNLPGGITTNLGLVVSNFKINDRDGSVDGGTPQSASALATKFNDEITTLRRMQVSWIDLDPLCPAGSPANGFFDGSDSDGFGTWDTYTTALYAAITGSNFGYASWWRYGGKKNYANWIAANGWGTVDITHLSEEGHVAHEGWFWSSVLKPALDLLAA